jgi:hypothetical protein
MRIKEKEHCPQPKLRFKLSRQKSSPSISNSAFSLPFLSSACTSLIGSLQALFRYTITKRVYVSGALYDPRLSMREGERGGREEGEKSVMQC